MPLYEYECDAQHHRFEVIQKFSDPPVAACPTCGGPVHKLIASPAFQFKGTGWYITDYAKKDSGDEPKGGSEKDKTAKESGGADKGDSDKKDAAAKSDAAPKAEAKAAPPASSDKTS